MIWYEMNLDKLFLDEINIDVLNVSEMIIGYDCRLTKSINELNLDEMTI